MDTLTMYYVSWRVVRRKNRFRTCKMCRMTIGKR